MIIRYEVRVTQGHAYTCSDAVVNTVHGCRVNLW